jgi:hypothetical protein
MEVNTKGPRDEITDLSNLITEAKDDHQN